MSIQSRRRLVGLCGSAVGVWLLATLLIPTATGAQPAPAQIQQALRTFLTQAHTWTMTQTFANIVVSGCTGCGGGGSGAFTDLTSGTNTTAAMVVGTGASLSRSGSGTITASAMAVSGLTGLGTGVGTALAINVGSAGAPVLFNGALGTPSSGTLTSATGLPIATGVSGLGTGVATALAVNIGSAGAFVTFNGALGTPSSGTLTNATGLPIAGITGLGSNVGTWLATPSSANLLAALTDETGTGLSVFNNSPLFVDDFDLGTAGVRLAGADGVLTLLGLGNGNDENLIIDLDNGTADFVDLDSGTGATTLNLKDPFTTIRMGNDTGGSTGNLIIGNQAFVSVEVVGGGNSSGRVFQRGAADFFLGHNVVGLFTIINGLSGIKLSPLAGADVIMENGAHFMTTGTAPTLTSGFGTGESCAGCTDSGGKITVGSGGDTTGLLTFNRTWTTAPTCWVQDETTSNIMRPTTTTTTLTITGVMVASDVLSYGCAR